MAGTVIAVNGSPRKRWNTALLLEQALEGAAEAGAQTEMVHLYDLNFKGCTSCFSCKTAARAHNGKCALRDDLSPVLERIAWADALILGSPIYLGAATGEFRSFLERLVFPFITYTDPPGTVFPRNIPVGVVYTMNMPEGAKDSGPFAFGQSLDLTEGFLARTFGRAESLYCYDTLQFEDYGKMYAPRFDPEAKARRRREVFPHDCEKARAMGKRFAEAAI